MLDNKYISAIIALLFMVTSNMAYGQFTRYTQSGPPGREQDTYNSNNQEETEVEKKKPAYTLKRYFNSLAHKDSVDVTRLTLGNMLLPGTAQLYNRNIWKIPVIYGTIGGCIGGAVYSNIKYQSTDKKSYKNMRSAFIAGAAVCYWGQLMDGIVSYKSDIKPHPSKAALYSALLPGLGQAYNGDYWKIPIFYGGFTISGYCWAFNQKQYRRYKNLYIEAATPDSGYKGHLSAEDLKWYRDSHRRLRDYSIIATGLIYVLNIIDANVFAHFNNFDVSDDISLNIEPSVIEPLTIPGLNDSGYRYLTDLSCPQAVGLKMNFKF